MRQRGGQSTTTRANWLDEDGVIYNTVYRDNVIAHSLFFSWIGNGYIGGNASTESLKTYKIMGGAALSYGIYMNKQGRILNGELFKKYQDAAFALADAIITVPWETGIKWNGKKWNTVPEDSPEYKAAQAKFTAFQGIWTDATITLPNGMTAPTAAEFNAAAASPQRKLANPVEINNLRMNAIQSNQARSRALNLFSDTLYRDLADAKLIGGTAFSDAKAVIEKAKADLIEAQKNYINAWDAYINGILTIPWELGPTTTNAASTTTPPKATTTPTVPPNATTTPTVPPKATTPLITTTPPTLPTMTKGAVSGTSNIVSLAAMDLLNSVASQGVAQSNVYKAHVSLLQAKKSAVKATVDAATKAIDDAIAANKTAEAAVDVAHDKYKKAIIAS